MRSPLPPDGRLTVVLAINDLRLGGAERQLVELARGLDKSRYRVTVATLYPGQPLEGELAGEPGLEVVSLGRRHRLDPSPIWRMARLLRQRRAHIVQPFLTPATFFALLGAIVAGTPVRIVTERCGLRLRPGLGSNVYRFLEDRLTRWAQVVVANSDAGRRYVVSRGVPAHKVRVVYNGVSAERVTCSDEEREAVRREVGAEDGTPLVGMVASLQPAKDYPTFLRAAALVAREVPTARFLVVGDGPLQPYLEAMAWGLGLGSRVVFAGRQLRVAPYIAAMDVAVLSSCDHEGCSNFLLEAMALGRPIVATDVGGNPELFRDGQPGLLVPARSPQVLAGAVLSLLRDEDLRRRCAADGLALWRRHFTVEAMVSAYDALYQELWRWRGMP
ncbi:MAG TPA: glycosyltransferase [Dehalococcoidia bacterium]|nr:glycosyltransferase [Dehalococcoidia bacterium]